MINISNGEFSQNGIISTYMTLEQGRQMKLKKIFLNFQKERKMELILPCLYSELEGTALPNIVEEISKTQII